MLSAYGSGLRVEGLGFRVDYGLWAETKIMENRMDKTTDNKMQPGFV